MPFNITTFKTELATNGVLQNNKYQVYVTPPPIFADSSLINPSTDGQIEVDMTSLSRSMLMRAAAVTVPSISLITSDVHRYGYGISQKMPQNAIFNVKNISFICDSKGSIWQFWYQWILSIFGFAGVDSGSGAIFNSSGNYNLQYKDNYSTTITTVLFDTFGNIAQEIDYTEAYPIGINDIPLSWDLDNQLIRIDVAMTYTDQMIVGSSLS